jgi:hypothetical protein
MVAGVTWKFIASHSMAKNGLDLKFDLPTDAELSAMFDMVPKLERYKVGDKVVRAGAKIVEKAAIELTPRSARTGSAKKRSLKQWREADYEYPLWKTIKYVVRKYQKHTQGVIGPEWPKGNKAYFNTSPKGRVKVLWGKHTGQIVAQIRNWIVQAFDETRPQQVDAMKTQLEKSLDELFKKNG